MKASATGGAGGGGAPGSGGATGTGGVVPGTGGTARSGGAGGGGAAGGSQGTGASGGSTGGAAAACDGVSPAYYLDSAAGDDAADGKTPGTAWKSLAKINAVALQPGDHVCLKAGGKWTGRFHPSGSGSASAPIVVSQYGTGARPSIAAGAMDDSAVYLLNQQYWEIANLEVTNTKSSPGDYRGISVNGQNGGTLNHIVIRDCFVHDVTGEVDWIGGDTADNQPGVTFETGWDAAKRTGGIVFDVQAGSGTVVKTTFNDVLVEGNTVQNCSFGGIVFKQLDGTVHWGNRSSAGDTTWTPHRGVVVRGNYVNQTGSALACDGIYATNMQSSLIEQNVINGAGTSAIELYQTDSVVVQKNEVFGTKRKANGADWNGIDTDKATTKTVIQYNYIHDNGDGILLCQFPFGDSIVRYNILQNNSRYQIYLHSDPSTASQIYNNTVYNDRSLTAVAYGYGDALMATYTLQNNIFFAAAASGVLTTAAKITYDHNLYFGSGIMLPAGDGKAVRSDPKLAAPGTGSSGAASGPAFSSLGGYKLQAGSPAIDAGIVVPNSGGMDFWGSPVVRAPDIGAFEAP